MRVDQIEERLAHQLCTDRGHPSRCHSTSNGDVIVEPSGTSVGLAIAIAMVTGEDVRTIMDRVGNT